MDCFASLAMTALHLNYRGCLKFESVNEWSERFRSGWVRPSRSLSSSAVSGPSVDAARPWSLAPATVPGHSRLPALEPAPPISANPSFHRSATPRRSRQCHPQSRSRRRLRLIGKSSSLLFSSWDSKTQPTPPCCTAICYCCIATMQFRASLMREGLFSWLGYAGSPLPDKI